MQHPLSKTLKGVSDSLQTLKFVQLRVQWDNREEGLANSPWCKVWVRNWLILEGFILYNCFPNHTIAFIKRNFLTLKMLVPFPFLQFLSTSLVVHISFTVGFWL